MLFLIFDVEKGMIKISNVLYCIVIVILYCPLKEVLLKRNFQLGQGKVSVVKRCPL